MGSARPNSGRPAAWRLATQSRGVWGLQWGAARRLLAKWKKNSRALWADLLPLSTGELQAGVQTPLQGAPVPAVVGLTVRGEAALTPPPTQDPPAVGGCDRPLLLSTCGRRSATWREATSSRLESHQVEGICWDRPQDDLCPGSDDNNLPWLGHHSDPGSDLVEISASSSLSRTRPNTNIFI